MNDSTYYDHIFKVLVIGDSSVGKTCYLLRYSDDTFVENHISTIGLDYRLKMISLPNDKTVKMQIWDTAGQDRFRAITKNYYKGAHGIVLMFDLTSEESFLNIKTWLGQVKENASDKIKVILVGNKSDAVDRRKIDKEKAENLSRDFDLKYFEASAKDNINVNESFAYLTKEILSVFEKNNKDDIKIGKSKKKSKCCKG